MPTAFEYIDLFILVAFAWAVGLYTGAVVIAHLAGKWGAE